MSKPFGIGEEAAVVMAQIICHNGLLPQGGCTSPIITNIICRTLDNELIALSKKYHLYYTRYADDLTFSTSQKIFPSQIARQEGNHCYLGEQLLNIISKNSFEVNLDKVHLNSHRSRQEVTGLIVNQYVNVRREYLKELRVMLHTSRNSGLFESARKYIEVTPKVDNIIVELSRKKNPSDKDKERVEAWYRSVLHGKRCFCVDSSNKTLQSLNENVFVIEGETRDGDLIQGTGFLLKGIGLVTNYHVVDDEDGKVIGLVECGPNSTREKDEKMMSGFMSLREIGIV